MEKIIAKKKPGKADTSIRAIKETLTKSALINLIAEQNDIPRKTASGVFDTLESVMLGSVGFAPGVSHTVLRQPGNKLVGEVGGPVIAEQPRSMPDADARQPLRSAIVRVSDTSVAVMVEHNFQARM